MSVWESFSSQKQWKIYIKNLLKKSDIAVKRAILCIYNNQTDEEKFCGKSIEDNGIGFSKIDAYEMGLLANKIKNNEQLSKGELARSRNKMQKYWKQLMLISKIKMAEKANQEQQRVQMQEEKYEMLRNYLIENYCKTLYFCEEGTQCTYGICDECPLVNPEYNMKGANE